MESRKIVLMNLFAGQEQNRRHREWACGHSRGRRGEENWESNTEMYTLYVKQMLMGSCCVTQGAQPGAEMSQRGGLRGWEGGPRGRGFMYIYR